MDRQKLDKLYLGSRSSPARVFMRAVSEDPLEASTYGFLLDHVDDVNIDVLIALFNAHLAPDVEPREKPLVRRLARLVPSADISQLLRVLGLAEKISAEAWIEDLTLPLKGQVPNYQWYRFVDKARGGAIFNALNVGIRRQPYDQDWNPDEMFVTSIEEARPEPSVVGLLERAHDDLAAAEFALKRQPVHELLRLNAMFPRFVTVEALTGVLRSRVSSTAESWAPSNEEPPLPAWIAPFVVERLHHCGEAEARILYEWLFGLPAATHDGDAYALAVLRFKHAVSGPRESFSDVSWWTPRIGLHLSTGASWKTKGSNFIALCIDLGRGFPPETIRAALAAAAERDGASPDEHRRAILSKVHDVTAKLLVERAERALKAGDYSAGGLLLAAFTSLDPGSFISTALHRLRKTPNLPPEIMARIESCEELARAGGREPNEDAFLEAFLVLTRQVS